LDPKEKELVRRVLEGDNDAFRELYQAHKRGLLRACWYFLGNEDDVQDVLQETFIKALRNLPRFRFECSLATWLNHIAVNLCRDLLEKQRKTHPFSLDFFSNRPSIAQKTPFPEEALKLLREEIEALEGKEKELVTLRDLKGLTYEAIANRLRMPVGSVTSGLFRARRKLIERVRARLPKEHLGGLAELDLGTGDA
jgi:RNA polymerase sigma-70 factor (ECF subfamily)